MDKTHILGIDFGTSHTFLCDTSQKTGTSTDVSIDGEPHNGCHTCIIHTSDGCFIGSSALQEYSMLTEKERKTTRFSANFKANLAVSENAEKDAESFLSELRKNVKNALISQDSNRAIIFGTPAKNLENYPEKLKKCAHNAGYGDVMTLPEPLGAALFHLAHGDISYSDAAGGVLVVDFGAGTLDIAFLRQLSLEGARCVWGNPLMGGRLFDDLFFQWFVEKNGGEQLIQRMEKDHVLNYIRLYKCMKLKEEFSDFWRRRTEKSGSGFHSEIRVKNTDYGYLKDITPEEFLARAGQYVPSKQLLSELGSLGEKDGFLNGELNLIHEFVKVVQSVSAGDFTVASIKKVILTGGSCRWPFVKEKVIETLGVSENQVVISSDPSSAIARGLSLFVTLKEKNEKILLRLLDRKHEMQERILNTIETVIAQTLDNLARQTCVELYDEKIAASIREFYEKSSPETEALEEKIKIFCQDYEQRFNQLTREAVKGISSLAKEQVRTEIKEWLEDNEVNCERLTRIQEFGRVSDFSAIGAHRVFAAGESLFDAMSAVFTGVSGAIAGALSGGGGIALIASGPIGTLIGIVIGVLLAGTVQDKIEKTGTGQTFKKDIARLSRKTGLETLAFHFKKALYSVNKNEYVKMLGIIDSLEDDIAKQRAAFRESIRQFLAEEFKKKNTDLAAITGNLVQQIIDEIGVLDVIEAK